MKSPNVSPARQEHLKRLLSAMANKPKVWNGFLFHCLMVARKGYFLTVNQAVAIEKQYRAQLRSTNWPRPSGASSRRQTTRKMLSSKAEKQARERLKKELDGRTKG